MCVCVCVCACVCVCVCVCVSKSVSKTLNQQVVFTKDEAFQRVVKKNVQRVSQSRGPTGNWMAWANEDPSKLL